MRDSERRNDDPGEAHAADDRPEQRLGVRVLVGTVARPGNLSFLSFFWGFSEIKRASLLASLFFFGKNQNLFLVFICALALSWSG